MRDLLLDATEPVGFDGAYDFAKTDLAGRISQKVMAIRFEARY